MLALVALAIPGLGQIELGASFPFPVQMAGSATSLPGECMVTADFDQDGDSDVVICQNNTCQIAGCGLWAPDSPGGVAYLENASGALMLPTVIASTAFASRAIELFDADQDSYPDVATLGHQGGAGGSGTHVTILINDTSGNLVPTLIVPCPLWARSITRGDYNGDGIDDLAITGGIGSSFFAQALISMGGTFIWTPAHSLTAPIGRAVSSDLNLDGCDDLILAMPGGLMVLPGTTTGHLASVSQVSLPLPSSTPVDLAAADLDGDGTEDIVTIHGTFGLSFAITSFADGVGGFSSHLMEAGPQGASYRSLELVDLDNDLDQDGLVTYVDVQGTYLGVLENRSAPGFTFLPIQVPVGAGADPLPLAFAQGLIVPHCFCWETDTGYAVINNTPHLASQTTSGLGDQLLIGITAPNHSNRTYAGGMAMSPAPGIALSDGRVVPLTLDPLLLYVLTVPTQPPGLSGMLDGSGSSQIVLNIPADPTFLGFEFYVALVVLDPAASLGIGSVSPATRIVVTL